MYLDWKMVVAISSRLDNMKDISVHPFSRQSKSRAKRLSGGWRGKSEVKSSLFLTSELEVEVEG